MSTNFSRLYFINLTTISNANPAVFTLTDHGLAPGDRIRLETTGSLPTGLAVKTDYYVVYNGLTTSTFQVSTGNGGDPLATTSAGSGTHSYMRMNKAALAPAYQNNR